MKVAEVRDLAVDDLRQRVKELDDQLFRLRIQKSMGQVEAAGKLKALRRDLDRVQTVLREKETAEWLRRHRSLALSSATRWTRR
jgi:large subunit ribosomal protein L29